MYRPIFRTLTDEALITFRKRRPTEPSPNLDAEIAHIEALYTATETELRAAQSLDTKMKSFEEALRETQRLILLLKNECPLKEQKILMLELVREKKLEAKHLEEEVETAKRTLAQATHTTTELSSQSLSVQFDHDEGFIH